MTARWLERRARFPLEITIFEASGRLGGKVMTGRFESAPVSYEAGVAELYHYDTYVDPLRALVDELGLPTKPLAGSSVVIDGRIIREPSDMGRVLGAEALRAVETFERRGERLRPYRAFYNGGSRSDNLHPYSAVPFSALLDPLASETARRYITVKTRSDLASEPHNVSALYGIDNLLLDRYVSYYSLEGGIETLPRTIAAKLSAQVRLHAPVMHVEQVASGRYRVVHRAPGGTDSAVFDAVAVALPNPFLPTISWGGARLAEAMSRHHAHYDFPAHYLRITALFEKPFWRRSIPGDYFLHDAFGGCCVYDEGRRFATGGRGVLSWLLAGSDALRMHSAEDHELVGMALDALPPTVAHGRALFLEGRVNRWIGAVSSRPGGRRIRTHSERHQPAPETHPGLVLVGDYLFDSTLNGVMDSADVASGYLLKHLKQVTPARAPKRRTA